MRHLWAAGAAMLFALAVSRTELTHSGLQFTGPLLLMLAVHWIAVPKRAGFAAGVWRDGAVTSAILAVAVLVLSVLAPMPAQASGNRVMESVLTVLFCVAIIAVVCIVLAIIGWIVFKVLAAIFRGVSGGDKPPDSRLFDTVGLSLGVVVLLGASLEGAVFGFSPNHQVSVTRLISADPAQVWHTMQTATSVDRRLPVILRNFPQPTDVRIDEGTGLGANRVVAFVGREGSGALHLRVTEASDSHAVFSVQSDTTPFAGWIGFQTLHYATAPTPDGTALTVSLGFERRLAPAIVFDPMMRRAAQLAAGVLANDVKARAEG